MNPRTVTLLILSSAMLACSDDNEPAAVVSTATVVPIRMVNNSPVIEVKVNGSPINVLFDIGRGTTLAIFPPQLDSITKRRVGSEPSGLSMTGPTGERPIYEVDIVEIGNIQFANATVVEDFHDDVFQESFATSLDAYGFIGTGLIAQHKIVIDYPNSELILIPQDASPGQLDLCRGEVLSLMQGQNWGIATKVDSDIGEIVLVWDTGTPENIILKSRTDESGLALIEGDTFSTDLFAIEGNNIGPQKLNVWDWRDNAPPFDGLMGYDFFAENVVCVDSLNKSILVRKQQ